MIVTIIKKSKFEFTDKEIEECKKHYEENPELSYNLGDKKEFLKCFYENEEFCEEYTDIEEKSYNEFLKKWNRI